MMTEAENNNTPNYYKKFLNIFLRYKYWYLLSILLCCAVAYTKLRYEVPKYIVNAKAVLKKPNLTTLEEQSNLMYNLSSSDAKITVENEIEIIKTNEVVKMAVLESDVYTKYYKANKHSADTPIHFEECPVKITLDDEDKFLENMKAPITLRCKMLEGNKCEVSYSLDGAPKEVTIDKFPSALATKYGNIHINRNEGKNIEDFYIIINTLDNATSSYLGALKVERTSKTSDVLNIKVDDYVVKDANAFLEALIKSYNHKNNAKKNDNARNIKNFLNNRISEIEADESYNAEDESRTNSIKVDYLYAMLLKKNAENDMKLEIDTDNLECIDGPKTVGMATHEPNYYYLVALLMAISIPSVIIYLKSLIYNKLRTEDEIKEYTNLPILGSVPLVKYLRKKCSIVVEENKNNVLNEVFRRLRTNLHFMMANHKDGNVIMVTSTNPGEGKRFLSSNLAMSLALLDKSVLLVSLNIRNDKLDEVFGYDNCDRGITTYLAANSSDVEMLNDLIVETDLNSHLHLLPTGLVPPNPAELLERENLDVAINYLKEKYDYIVIDASSTSQVVDAIIASRVANQLLYVVNYKYATASNISYINSLVRDGKLKNVSIVLNAKESDIIKNKKQS